MRSLILAVLTSTLIHSGTSVAQGNAGIVIKKDVMYGRVQGSALRADLAYPDVAGPSKRRALMYVHGGRWRSGTRNDDRAVNVAKWAEAGYLTMTID